MLYSSTRGSENSVEFEKVVLSGLASDGGLFVPDEISQISKSKLNNMRDLSYSELVHQITWIFVKSNISKEDYTKICEITYNEFSDNEIISIKKLNNKEYILNLFHGPTLAFKDYALQLLGNIYNFILKKKKIKLTIVGATSGDTGSAAIHGCSKSNLIKMFILFPYNKVSPIQRMQMTTFNKSNVFNLAIKGDFDDCQNLVKSLFEINEKEKKFNLAAVNSINWVRIMGQIVYYFWAYFNCCDDNEMINFSVPTGNFGNAYAAFIAMKMGLPINKIIIASNKNDVLTRFFETGQMKKLKTFETLSPSMDIQVSSNFERLLYHYIDKVEVNQLFLRLKSKGDFQLSKSIISKMKKRFQVGRLDDNKTTDCIKKMFLKYKIVVDPHTAVGISIGKRFLNKENIKNVYLATAHYGKFLNTINKSLEKKMKLPDKLNNLKSYEEKFDILDNDVEKLKNYIQSNN